MSDPILEEKLRKLEIRVSEFEQNPDVKQQERIARLESALRLVRNGLPYQHGRVVDAVLADVPTLPDLDLLRKLASGEGGRRTGDLMRRGFIEVTITDAGLEALMARSLDSRRRMEDPDA